MPKRKGVPPRYTFWRGSSLWGRVTIRGKERRWSLRTGDVALAKVRVEADRKRFLAQAHYGDDRQTYEAVVTSWAERYVSHQVAPRTAARYAMSLKQLEPWLLPLHFDEVDSAKVREVVQRRRAAGVSDATIRRDLTALSSVFEHAIDEEWCDEEHNPALARLKRLKERRNPIVLPEHHHIAQVIARAPGRLAALVETALKTGCRQDELVHAHRTNFDYARRQLTVIGKRNKLRVVDLGFGDCHELLRAQPVRLGCRWLFWHHDGERYKNVASRFAALVAGVHRTAQKTAQAAGLPDPDFRPFTFHHLRHRHAVDWLKAGRNIYDLQQRLGHRSIKTTELYLEFLTAEEARLVKYGTAQNTEHVQRFGEGGNLK
jgi:integrase/recombinase XerD